MNDSKIFRWTGVFGITGFLYILFALPLYYLGGQEPPIQETVQTGEFVTRTAALIIARATIADPIIMDAWRFPRWLQTPWVLSPSYCRIKIIEVDLVNKEGQCLHIISLQ